MTFYPSIENLCLHGEILCECWRSSANIKYIDHIISVTVCTRFFKRKQANTSTLYFHVSIVTNPRSKIVDTYMHICTKEAHVTEILPKLKKHKKKTTQVPDIVLPRKWPGNTKLWYKLVQWPILKINMHIQCVHQINHNYEA